MTIQSTPSLHRKRHKSLGVPELIAIALGGMVGGGIFSVLGISVSMIGALTPIAFALGGVMASFAAYSYVKLAAYFKDEGATYSFFKRTFPRSTNTASLIGWWVVFGYISTLALYAYTFSSYLISGFSFAENEWIRKAIACGVIGVFSLINIWSVKGMGKIEDIMVYTKIILLVVISIVLVKSSHASLPVLFENTDSASILNVLIVASLTFVAYEGFQLVIHATNEMDCPEKKIPISIYTAIVLATAVYVIIALGAILAIPFEEIVLKKEYALASGAESVLGYWGTNFVILGALLATSSAISATLFGASRLMAVIADDGFFPAFLAKRSHHIPVPAIIVMAGSAAFLILIGNLRLILEFGSMTFLLVSLLMAYANHRIRHLTNSSKFLTIPSLIGLAAGMALIIYFEAITEIEQLMFIATLYVVLSVGSWLFTTISRRGTSENVN
jgi:amino acid transporter